MIIKNDLLGYRRLDIYQDSEMFHFSIDSMLLADFVRIKKGTKKILDLGTGNAAIPLFLTLKTSAEIHGIEIQEAVYNLGVRSVKENNLESQIQLHLGDMKEAPQLFKNQAFDIVISNPPF
ncbi:MAG: methyltransferase domain-containing protein, partial [Acholeplasmatales bacterium]|nr:methyltransferase domain-containing protein [Acholeplasmatales bacterium]